MTTPKVTGPNLSKRTLTIAKTTTKRVEHSRDSTIKAGQPTIEGEEGETSNPASEVNSATSTTRKLLKRETENQDNNDHHSRSDSRRNMCRDGKTNVKLHLPIIAPRTTRTRKRNIAKNDRMSAYVRSVSEFE